VVVVILASVAAACAGPRGVSAPVRTVETLPRGDGSVRRGPFDMAAPDMQAARRLLGCYAVTLGPWSDPRAHGDSVPVPSRLDLLADGHRRTYIGFRLVARTPGFAAQLEAYPAAWSPIGDDSLQVRVWANGRSSVAFFLRRRSDEELRGTARYFIDALAVDSAGGWLWESYPTATVSLRHAPCD
jgi:hypothetical protein